MQQIKQEVNQLSKINNLNSNNQKQNKKTYIILQTMSLKQHNDIVQKLLKQLDSKQKQLQSLRKQMHKQSASQFSSQQASSKNLQTDKDTSKKIAQLHKEYKDKISNLNQQVRNRSLQNKDLKERLTTLKNIQTREKEHVEEMMKKLGVIASSDPKFAAVISHYQSQLQKKNKYIANLQKQAKQQHYQKQTSQPTIPPTQMQQQDPQNTPSDPNIPTFSTKQHYHTKYQQQINSLRNQCSKYQRLFEQKSKEFRDLTSRYADLTKEYYRMMNQYQCGDGDNGDLAQAMKKNKNQPQSNVNDNANMSKGLKKNSHMSNILQEMLQNFDQNSQSCLQSPQNSLSYSFLSNYTKKRPQEKLLSSDSTTELQSLQDLVSSIIQLLQVENRVQIIPTITKLKIKCEEGGVYVNIAKHVHAMLSRVGMGKIPMSEILEALERFEVKIAKYMESSELMDEVCIQVGAKKQKLLEKIKDYKATQQQFFINMKNVDFMQKLPKANKIIEFIEYFQLEKEVCELPDQLKKMYQQLKYVDKFLKQAALILQKQPQGLQKSLQSILRFLERKMAQQSLRTQQKIKKIK